MNEETAKKTAQKTLGDKLKNETTAGEAMKKKLRHGKKDNLITKEEAKANVKLKRQGRKKAYKEVAAKDAVRRSAVNSDNYNEDENVGTESLEAGIDLALTAANVVEAKIKSSHYSKKMHERRDADFKKEDIKKHDGSNPQSKAMQRNRMKKEIQENAHRKQAKEAANQVGSLGRKFVDQAEDLMGKLAEFIKEHPKEIFISCLILLILLVMSACLSSCSAVMGSLSNSSVATSYTSQDSDILAVDRAYTQLETDLQNEVNSVETNYPGYDEYRYDLANIGHNQYQLAALLTVLYEDYTLAEVQQMLNTIFDAQYDLTYQRIVERRSREETRTGTRTVRHQDGSTTTETYTYTVTVYYDYYILKTTLKNYTMDAVVNGMNLSADQMQRYQILLENCGNKAYLWGDDIYSTVDPGDYQDYDIPPEALTDTKFANMIREGEKYLGYPYVWGGSSPSTSFDCSGFVSYVINHCGNGWSVGRQTANGLLGKCTRVSATEARPGDLIFFQGTYNTSGASHVGIYVGNGMMLHCGNPIQYTSINTNYWIQHFYCYGRIN